MGQYAGRLIPLEGSRLAHDCLQGRHMDSIQPFAPGKVLVLRGSRRACSQVPVEPDEPSLEVGIVGFKLEATDGHVPRG